MTSEVRTDRKQTNKPAAGFGLAENAAFLKLWLGVTQANVSTSIVLRLLDVCVNCQHLSLVSVISGCSMCGRALERREEGGRWSR